jgi:hypothetical protein
MSHAFENVIDEAITKKCNLTFASTHFILRHKKITGKIM